MLDFAGKLVLAPMVRSGELPTRLLALKYGCDIVWTPEIVDKKILTCSRVETPTTVDFVDPNGKIIFSTHKALEKGRLVFQMGSASPEIAVRAGLKVINDVDGIDLNCGCPKNFSIHAGMGAELLKTPTLLCSILENLVQNVGRPHNKSISCKIRLLGKDDSADTLKLIEKICQTGIQNLTLHCRTREMRNREAPIHHFLEEIIKITKKYGISFIINGNIMNRLEFLQLQQSYGSDVGCMIAESAESNPSCFSLDPVPWNQVVKEFLNICCNVKNLAPNSKYIVLNQIPSRSKYYQMFAKLKTNKDLLDLANQIQEDEDKFVGKIKFKQLQKDKLYTQQEYDDWKKTVLDQTDANNAKEQRVDVKAILAQNATKHLLEESSDKENQGSSKKPKHNLIDQ